MIIGIPSEIKTGEKRVAMSPANVQSLTDKSVKVLFQTNAGVLQAIPDAEYTAAGATITADRAEIFARQILFCRYRSFGSNNENSDADLASLRKGQLVIGMMDPLASPQAAQAVADQGATAIALELVPRISRAQSMDVLSSMATLAGIQGCVDGCLCSAANFPYANDRRRHLTASARLDYGCGCCRACRPAQRPSVWALWLKPTMCGPRLASRFSQSVPSL